MERAAFNFIPLSEPRREQHVVEPSAVESSYQHYEPYQANQGGFSFSGTQTPTAIVI